jgi:hypothetical protein
MPSHLKLHGCRHDTRVMKISRHTFLGILGGLGAALKQASGQLNGDHQGVAEAGCGAGIHLPEGALIQWLLMPRIPVLASADPVVRCFIAAALARRKVEFIYFGGSTPGTRRLVSPGLVFRVAAIGPVYVSGFCHLRQEERVFRLDRVMPAASVN